MWMSTFGELAVDGFFLEYDDARSDGFEPLRFVPRGKKRVVLVSSRARRSGSSKPRRRTNGDMRSPQRNRVFRPRLLPLDRRIDETARALRIALDIDWQRGGAA
jgi:hypothetical protein